MKVVNYKQKSPEWLAWRSQGITATDASIILGKSPYKTPWRLWAEKTGYANPEDLSKNPNVQRGVELEDQARKVVEEEMGDILLPVCIEENDGSIFRASLDGITSDGRPVELKCPSQKVWDEVVEQGENSAPYRLYAIQVQYQILVSGAGEGLLVFFREGEKIEFVIKRDEALIDQLRTECTKFWEMVEKKVEPPKDPERDLFLPGDAEASEWVMQAEIYRLAEQRIKALKEEIAKLEEQQQPAIERMKELMGDFNVADYAGVAITRYSVSGRIDYKRIVESLDVSPEVIEQYRGKDAERYRVTVTNAAPKRIVDETVLAPIKDMAEEVKTFYW